MATPQKKRLGEILLEAGIIDGAQLQAALGHQRRWGGRIGQALIDLKMATEEQIVSTLASKLGFERTPVDQVEWGPGLELALRLVPHEFADRNQVLAYAADPNHVWVAMADPTNVGVIDELAFRTGRRVKISIAGDREIARTIRRLYLGDKRGVEAISLDEQDDAPVEMVGPLDPLHAQPLDEFFGPPPAAAPSAPRPAPPVVHPASPTPSTGTTPPPMPVTAPPGPPPASAPVTGPAARLAEAVRGLKAEDAAVMAPLPEAPPELVIEVEGEEEEEEELAPRVRAIVDGLERIGASPGSSPELGRLARFSSALVRILLRKRLVSEDELAAAYVQAERGSPKR